MIHIVRYLLIAIGVALIPAWRLWIFIGWIMDRRGQRRALAMMKGDGESLP